MPIICFFGPDGSGKSTLAKNLAGRLTKRGFAVRISWMRGSHTFLSLLSRFLSRFRSFRGSENPYYNLSIPNNLKRLWQWLEFLGALPVIILKFVMPSLIGYWVVADRYCPDLAIWVALTTRDHKFIERLEAKILMAVALKADIKIYVTARIDELIKREKKSWLLKEQINLYDRLAGATCAYKLDTTRKDVDEAIKEVSTLVKMKAS